MTPKMASLSRYFIGIALPGIVTCVVSSYFSYQKSKMEAELGYQALAGAVKELQPATEKLQLQVATLEGRSQVLEKCIPQEPKPRSAEHGVLRPVHPERPASGLSGLMGSGSVQAEIDIPIAAAPMPRAKALPETFDKAVENNVSNPKSEDPCLNMKRSS